MDKKTLSAPVEQAPRRIIRRTTGLICILSIVLWTFLLWRRFQNVSDTLYLNGPYGGTQLVGLRGDLGIWVGWFVLDVEEEYSAGHILSAPAMGVSEWVLSNFSIGLDQKISIFGVQLLIGESGAYRDCYLTIAHWYLLLPPLVKYVIFPRFRPSRSRGFPVTAQQRGAETAGTETGPD